jgi:hypothetical protein
MTGYAPPPWYSITHRVYRADDEELGESKGKRAKDRKVGQIVESRPWEQAWAS